MPIPLSPGSEVRRIGLIPWSESVDHKTGGPELKGGISAGVKTMVRFYPSLVEGFSIDEVAGELIDCSPTLGGRQKVSLPKCYAKKPGMGNSCLPCRLGA